MIFVIFEVFFQFSNYSLGNTGTGMFGGGGNSTGSGLFGGGQTNKTSGSFFSGGNTSGGGSNTGLFGGGNKGMSSGNTLFGQKTNNMNQNTGNKSTFFSSSSGSAFNKGTSGFRSGNTTGGSSFGSGGSVRLEEGTSGMQFNGYKDKDHGSDNKNTITLNAITAEPNCQHFSLEEFRMADYLLKKQGKVNFPIGSQPAQNTTSPSFGGGGGTGMFGQNKSNPFSGGSSTTMNKPNTSFFGNSGTSSGK